jgi:hypothetical protein
MTDCCSSIISLSKNLKINKMNTIDTINTSLKDINSDLLPNVEKRSHSTSILCGILLLLLAAAMLATPVLFGNQTVSYAMIFIGILISCFGLYKIFWQSKCLLYSDTKSIIRRHDYYYGAEDFANIKTAFEEKNVEGLSKLKSHDDGNVRMRVMSSKDCQYAAAQIFRYVPYDYKAESDVVVWRGKEAERFIKAIRD